MSIFLSAGLLQSISSPWLASPVNGNSTGASSMSADLFLRFPHPQPQPQLKLLFNYLLLSIVPEINLLQSEEEGVGIRELNHCFCVSALDPSPIPPEGTDAQGFISETMECRQNNVGERVNL